MNGSTCDILVIDDDPGHAELVRRNLVRGGIANAIRTLHDPIEAERWLLGEGAQASVLILLDIHMPGRNGMDLLGTLRQHPHHRATPVIMLTTTDDPREIRRCYELGCSSFVSKPVEIQQFIEVVRRLGLFLSILKVPGP